MYEGKKENDKKRSFKSEPNGGTKKQKMFVQLGNYQDPKVLYR